MLPLGAKDSLTLRTDVSLKGQSTYFSLFVETIQDELLVRCQRQRAVASAKSLSNTPARSMAANT